MIGLIILFIVAMIIIFFGAATKEDREKNRERIEKQRLEREESQRREKQERIDLNNAKIREEEEELGRPDKIITDYYKWEVAEKSYERSIRYYGSKGILVLFGRRVNCSDIISCELIDNPTVSTDHRINSESQTRNNESGMYGGGFLGTYGSSSSGHVSTSGNITGNQTLKHNYSIRINVKDVIDPLIKMSFKMNGSAEEVYALVQAIIEIEKSKKT